MGKILSTAVLQLIDGSNSSNAATVRPLKFLLHVKYLSSDAFRRVLRFQSAWKFISTWVRRLMILGSQRYSSRQRILAVNFKYKVLFYVKSFMKQFEHYLTFRGWSYNLFGGQIFRKFWWFKFGFLIPTIV